MTPEGTAARATTGKTAELRGVRHASRRLADATKAMNRAREDRDAAIVKAQAGGATYADLATAASLTPDRVKQLLAAHRD